MIVKGKADIVFNKELNKYERIIYVIWGVYLISYIIEDDKILKKVIESFIFENGIRDYLHYLTEIDFEVNSTEIEEMIFISQTKKINKFISKKRFNN